jgi:nuclear transport factor 2 (NTF2) superfamily protein
MNQGFVPPLTLDKAAEAVKFAESIWNKGEAQETAELFNNNCEWRDNQRHLHGKQDILNFLLKKQRDETNYQLRAELWSHSFFRLAVSFQSEWQNVGNEQWLRSSGHIFIRLDSFGLINEFCLSTNGKVITAKERSIGFNSALPFR